MNDDTYHGQDGMEAAKDMRMEMEDEEKERRPTKLKLNCPVCQSEWLTPVVTFDMILPKPVASFRIDCADCKHLGKVTDLMGSVDEFLKTKN